MSHAFEFDPEEILGISPQASLETIHEAYRAKSRLHHPDVGGEAWAFRLVNRSYEILSRARVASRVSQEYARDAGPGVYMETPGPTERFQAEQEVKAEGGQTRYGVKDKGYAPELMVAIEMLLLRYTQHDPLALLYESPEQRNLSCNLSVEWPTCAVPGDPHRTVDLIKRAFRKACRATKVLDSGMIERAGSVSGWIRCGSAHDVEAAFLAMRSSLNAAGMGVQQVIRELNLPRP